MTNYDVLKKLIGHIEPVGESHTDDARYYNLMEQCDIVEQLLHEVKQVSEYKDKVEYSMKKSGVFARQFLERIKEELES